MTHDNSARRRGLAPLRLACARLRCASPLRQPDGPLAQGCALCPNVTFLSGAKQVTFLLARDT